MCHRAPVADDPRRQELADAVASRLPPAVAFVADADELGGKAARAPVANDAALDEGVGLNAHANTSSVVTNCFRTHFSC